jgi:hypothetical protein
MPRKRPREPKKEKIITLFANQETEQESEVSPTVALSRGLRSMRLSPLRNSFSYLPDCPF